MVVERKGRFEMKKWFGFLMALVMALPMTSPAATATATLVASRSKASAAVTLGKWHAGFSKCKQYAEKNKIPLIAVWSNGESCPHCTKFERAVNSTVFKTWMKTSGCVFFFTYPGDGADGKIGSTVFHWCRNNKNTNYPFVRIYWPAGKVDVATVGDTVDGNLDGSEGGKKARDYIKAKIAKYKYTPPPPKPAAYSGGVFDVSGVEGSRLEAEIGNTASVSVSLSRTNTVVETVSTNKVVVLYPDGQTVTNAISWASGDASTNLTVDINGSLTNAGQQVTLLLLDNAGKAVATNHITLVEEPENSPKNPRWIGERDVETLAWGEWTMDLDVATNKVAAYNRGRSGSSTEKAHTLLLIGGPLWCPDCWRAEEYLIGTQEFRDWATSGKIACVAIDEPRFAKGSLDRPTLLTPHEQTLSSGITVSGASYLSRKAVDPELAARMLARNLDFVNKDTRNGGYCTPDNLDSSGNTGSWRTGIPCIIVLREDGSVAGRLFQFSNSTTALEDGSVSTAALVQRLSEIVAQDADVNEELNDSRHTTPETLGLQQTVADRTLSFSDLSDFFRLDPEQTLGQRVRVRLSPVAERADFLPGTRLEVKIIQASGSSTKVLATTVAPLDGPDGVECVAEIASTNCYVAVGYPTDSNAYALDKQFQLSNLHSTLCHYSLTTDFVAVPDEVCRKVAVDGETLSIALRSNTVYRLTGLLPGANGGILVPAEGVEDGYVALVTDDAVLSVVPGEVCYQIWNPGVVGFVRTSMSVSEPKNGKPTPTTIGLARTGGVSGRAIVTVVKNAEKSSALDGLVELGGEFAETFTWEEGDDAVKTLSLKVLDNEFADGDQSLYFDVVRQAGCDAAEGVMQFRLTLLDNDKKTPGRLALVETDPACASGMTLFQRAGETVKVGVGRVDGTTGVLAGSLATTAGVLSETAFSWQGRETATQFAELPLAADGAGRKVKVTLTPAVGTAVDSTRRTLTVNVLAADAPGFEAAAVMADAVRYVPMTERTVALDDKALDGATIKKYSGALAPGLVWKQDNRNLVLSGVPTKAGVFTAVFRAYNGSVAGLTVAVTVNVTDPVLAGGGATGTEPVNPSVAVSRTFTDVPVCEAATNRLAGLLTLTLPRTGRASAKYRRVDGTTTLSCANWSAIDGDGALMAELQDKTGSCTLTVVAAADGTVTATLVDPDRANGVVCGPLEKAWSASSPAGDFKGYYTVSLPAKTICSGVVFATGDASVTLKMNATASIQKGLFTFAGVYPNGQPFSGSAILAPRSWNEEFGYHEYAVLPLLTAGTADALAGMVRLTPGAADPTAADMDAEGLRCEGRCSYQNIRRSVHPASEAALVWAHGEKAADACAEVELDAFGTYYVSTENFANCCTSALGTTKLKFFVLEGFNAVPEATLEAKDLYLGKGECDWTDSLSLTGANVSYAKLTSTAKTKTNQIVAADAKKLTFSFAVSTGLVTGSFKAPFGGGTVTVSFKGVVMPAWGSQECADCGLGGFEATLRPFISGTAWFNDALHYVDELGRARTVTIRRSCPFSVGVKAGE